ncbi:AAA family ATPase [Archangium primigenium]|uniref:AAA family ATPase n=1 Tax=[Archangium] primigenium TaxID=2792470 RepID=UPI0019593E10|nr:AAA family ATPase [Archangium primigenium]
MVRREWTARVLGVGGLEGPEGQRLRLERRAAALLAWLGLEGPSLKFSLACLLWPDSPPATARGNMRQLLRRLRVLGGGVEWVEATAEQLALAPGLWVDVAALKAAAGARDPARALEALPPEGGAPVLLAGLELDADDELSRWLVGARATVDGWVRAAREARIEHHLAQAEWAPALALLEGWLRQEPECERAGGHLIRWHYLQGDRSAALAAFERLRATLSRELGVSPLPETLALVRQIEKGQAPARATTPPLPLSVQRPPVLTGREAAWRQLEEGRAAGQLLLIRGEPGVGKSRLAEEFAASQGRWLRIMGRYGDQGIPFASQARALRAHLARRPEVRLPEWVREELARVLPELATAPPRPPPDPEGSELRFLEAHAEAMRLLMDEDVVIVDDLQYWDAASARVFVYAFGRLFDSDGSPGPRPCFIDCYRRGELPAYSEHNIQHLVDTGLARIIDLEPLSPEEVQRFVASLELPGAERQALALARYTGGNPLYLIETLKHLLETNGLDKDWPARLPPPGRVAHLLQRRLERLSPLALKLAQVATLRETPLPLALAAALFEAAPTEVQAALAELEAAQVLVGARFSHDLVEEAVRASLSPTEARVLGSRLAEQAWH